MTAWLKPVIAHGLQRLIALRLKGAPPEDTLVLTAEVWLETLCSMNVNWDQEQDTHRLDAAFKALCRDFEYWPAPKNLIERLPRRKPLVGLPPEKLDAEELEAKRKENRKKVKEILQILTQQKGLKQ